MNHLTLITKAIKAVPAVRYALGVAGIAAVVAVILGLKLNPQVAVFGSIIVIGFMFLLLVFARAAGQGNNSALLLPARVLVWFFTIVTMVVTVLFISSYFGHWPISFERAPDEKPSAKVKNEPIAPSAPPETEMAARLNVIRKRYIDAHPRDSGTGVTQKNPPAIPEPTSGRSDGQQPDNSVFDELRREAQWANSLKIDCQNTALYRSQQFYSPYKFGPLMGQPMPRTLDDAQVQSLQDDELEMIRRYDSEKALLLRAHDNAIATMKAVTTANLKFSPNDEIKDSLSFREANYEAAKLTPIVDLRNNNTPTCTRFRKLDEYLSALLTKLGNY